MDHRVLKNNQKSNHYTCFKDRYPYWATIIEEIFKQKNLLYYINSPDSDQTCKKAQNARTLILYSLDDTTFLEFFNIATPKLLCLSNSNFEISLCSTYRKSSKNL